MIKASDFKTRLGQLAFSCSPEFYGITENNKKKAQSKYLDLFGRCIGAFKENPSDGLPTVNNIYNFTSRKTDDFG